MEDWNRYTGVVFDGSRGTVASERMKTGIGFYFRDSRCMRMPLGERRGLSIDVYFPSLEQDERDSSSTL